MVYFNFNKEYTGYNKAMGKYITGKNHFYEEMKRGGYCFKDEADQRVEEVKERRKRYSTSSDAHAILEACKASADKKGNVKMPDRAVDALKNMGVKFERNLPEHYRNLDPKQGGMIND